MIRKIEADERQPSTQLAELLAEQLQVPADQVEAFVGFARGVEVGDQTGLEALGEGGWADLPPVPDDAGAAIPHNLPAQTTPFFGRQDELAILAGLLADPHKRLVTVLGPGGMGKTRLALAAAEEQLNSPDGAQRFGNDAQRFRDGIYFVPLAGVAAADSLASAVAEAIDFQFSGADEPQAQLLRYLGKRHTLLVLDNFEHLLTGVGLVQAILEDCPAVELLVTSREKLKLGTEQVFPIRGLTYPTGDETFEPEQAAAYSAVQLFVERARNVHPSFELSDDNLKAMAAICRQVDGMPLGLVLAAAWVDTLTVAEIAREIDRDLAFLETELSDVPARQRSLQAAFNHSWRMLNSKEQEVYCQLSVFRGGFSAEAAEAVAGASLRDLQALVNKSLLTRSHAEGQTAARYGIHELLRQFAAGELARQPELQDAARDRHSAYYLALLQKLEPDWRTGRQLETLATVSRESDNINAAWSRALATGAWEQLAGAMDSWGQYHYWRGLFVDGNALCVALESRLKGVMDTSETPSFACTTLRIKTLAWQGVFLSSTEEALVKFEESLAFLEGQDSDAPQIRRLKAFVLRQMAWRLLSVDIRKARHCAAQALQLSLGLEDRWQMAESHYYLGALYWRLGQLAEARESTEIALALFRELGDRRMEVRSNIILAWVFQIEGDFTAAERLRYETLDLCRQIGDRPFLVYCLGDLTYTLVYRGKLDEGLRTAEQCVTLSVEYGIREKEGWARMNLGHLLMHLGDYDRARWEAERGLDLVKETGNRDVETGLLSILGYLALLPGDNGREAQAFFEKALRLSEPVHDEVFLGFKLSGLLLAACQLGAGNQARQFARTYLEYVIRTRNYEHLIEALADLAFYLAYFGSKQKARAVWRQVKGQPYIEASRWFEDVIGREIVALTADLAPEPSPVVTKDDLWQTAESLLADLK
jgi:predicted ATPase